MSKYIRVSEDDREYLTTYQEHCEEVAALQDDGYDFEGCILKRADTIEELCDEFVEAGSYQPTLVEVRFELWDKETKNILIKQGIQVYGAIWTDKGLIYVAKMNEKGELELL